MLVHIRSKPTHCWDSSILAQAGYNAQHMRSTTVTWNHFCTVLYGTANTPDLYVSPPRWLWILKFCHTANILDLYQHPQSTEMNWFERGSKEMNWFERGSTEMTSFERGSTEMTSLHVHCFKHQTKQHKFIPSYKMSKKEQTWGRQVQAVRPCQIPMRTHNYLMSVQGSVEPQRSMQSWLQCDVPGRTATLPPGKVTDHIHHLTVWP